MRRYFNFTYNCIHDYKAGTFEPVKPKKVANPLFLLNPGNEPAEGAWDSHILLKKMARQYPGLQILDVTNYTEEERGIAHMLYSTIEGAHQFFLPCLVDQHQANTPSAGTINLHGVHTGAGTFGYKDYLAGIMQINSMVRNAPTVLVCECRYSWVMPCHLTELARHVHQQTDCPVFRLRWPYDGQPKPVIFSEGVR